MSRLIWRNSILFNLLTNFLLRPLPKRHLYPNNVYFLSPQTSRKRCIYAPSFPTNVFSPLLTSVPFSPRTPPKAASFASMFFPFLCKQAAKAASFPSHPYFRFSYKRAAAGASLCPPSSQMALPLILPVFCQSATPFSILLSLTTALALLLQACCQSCTPFVHSPLSQLRLLFSSRRAAKAAKSAASAPSQPGSVGYPNKPPFGNFPVGNLQLDLNSQPAVGFGHGGCAVCLCIG